MKKNQNDIKSNEISSLAIDEYRHRQYYCDILGYVSHWWGHIQNSYTAVGRS